MVSDFKLSKSKYCLGVQCPKILWLNEHKPEESMGEILESVLENGRIVGELAREYFGDYELVEFSYDKKEMCNTTDSLINSGARNIAEASFIYDGLYCAVDILHKNGDDWEIVEVKSATSVAPEYIDDMAFQLYILEKCGLSIRSVYNLHIDNTYVRHGALELSGLFVLEDCTAEVRVNSSFVKERIQDIRQYMTRNDEEDRDIDVTCDSPYECSFKAYCSRHLPKNTVFDVRKLALNKKYDLYHQGIVTFDDLLDHNTKLSPKQMMQILTEVEDRPEHIEVNEIIHFLNTLQYPIYHLDFETFQQAVPEFEGGKPYGQIPFQYSLHIEQKDGKLEHNEFLAKEGTDPRRALAEQLCKDIPMGVCSLAYNMSFEKMVLKRLAELYMDLADHLMDIHDNMHDLMVPFSKGYYYSKPMKGSYSIKYVLPALYPYDPELDYHSLDEVHNGAEASAAFLTMASKTPEEIATLRANLLKYCGLDTYAMVKVLAKLREVVECHSK